MTLELTPERYRVLRELFHKAVELAPAEREAFLAAECRHDPRLRAEVEELLAGVGAPDPLGEHPELRTDLLAQLGAAPDDELAGVPPRVGPYRVLRLIGAGGMGRVFEAEQDRPRRRVALKMIHTRWVSPRSARRFDDEVEILGRLDHPNVARIHDSGVVDGPSGPIRYFAMELVEGRSLTEWVAAAAPSRAERLRAFRGICAALVEAHNRGVIHRDLKPENVMIDGDGRPRVLDFGIARLCDDALRPDDARTRDGELVGTPRYMSPEQLAGDPRAIDTRSDVYSLGVLLFELVAGELPERDASSVPGDALRQAEGRRRRSLRDACPDADPDLVTIVAKALERDPAERYQSVRDLDADVAALLERRPIRARPPSLARRLRLFAARRRATFAGIAVGVAVVVAALVLAAVSAVRAVEAGREAVESERLALRQTYRAQISAASSAQQARDVRSARRFLAATDPQLRGFEWGYLAGLLEQSERVLTGHGSQVWDAAFAPDGSWIATVGGAVIAEPFDRGLRVWDVATGAELLHVETPDDELLHVAVHPDGRRIATADGEVDSALRLWDARTGAELAVLEGHGGRVRGLEFDPEGRWLVSASDDGVVRRAGEVDGAWRSELLDADAGAVTAIAVADGWLYVLAEDRPLRALELESGAAGRAWELRGEALALAPDGRAAVAELDGTVGVYRLADAPLRELLLDPGDRPIDLAFARDGATLYCASEGQQVLGFDMRDGRVVERLTGHDSWVNALAVSPVAPLLASASEDRTIRLWSTASEPEPASERAVVRGAAVAPSGRTLATVDFAGRLRLLDLASEALVLEVDVPAEHVHAVAIDEARGWLACDARERILVAPLDGGAPRLLDGAHTGSVLGLAHDPRSGRLASCSADGSLAVWDVATGDLELRATIGGEPLWSVAWSPSGERVVAASDDGRLRVWSVAEGRLVLDVQADEGQIYAVDWSPDGTRIATGGWQRALRLFDAETGALQQELTGHSMLVYDVAFSPDGRRLASASSDRSVTIWDPEAGHDLLTIRALHEPCFAAAWSPACDALVVGSAGGAHVLRAAAR